MVDIPAYYKGVQVYKTTLTRLDFDDLKKQCVKNKDTFLTALNEISKNAKDNTVANPDSLLSCFRSLKYLKMSYKEIRRREGRPLHKCVKMCCANKTAVKIYKKAASTIGLLSVIAIQTASLFRPEFVIALIIGGSGCTCGAAICGCVADCASERFEILDIDPDDRRRYKIYSDFFKNFTTCNFDVCREMVDHPLEHERSLINETALRHFINMAESIPKEIIDELKRAMEAEAEKYKKSDSKSHIATFPFSHSFSFLNKAEVMNQSTNFEVEFSLLNSSNNEFNFINFIKLSFIFDKEREEAFLKKETKKDDSPKGPSQTEEMGEMGSSSHSSESSSSHHQQEKAEESDN